MLTSRKRTKPPIYEPTPWEIRQAAEAIQATWSPKERVKRNCYPEGSQWHLPTIEVGGMATIIAEEECERRRALEKVLKHSTE